MNIAWKEPERRFIEKAARQFGFNLDETEERLLKSGSVRPGVVVSDGEILDLVNKTVEDKLKAPDEKELAALRCSERWKKEHEISKRPLTDPVDYSDLCHVQNLLFSINHEKDSEKPLDFCCFPKLKELFVVNSQARSFYISDCVELEVISSQNCPHIDKMNFSHNKKLKKMQFVNIQLKKLDISNNQLLEDVFLWSDELIEVKLAHGGRLRSLSLGTGKYSSLPLEDCSGLQFLSLTCINMNQLDLSLVPGLIELKLWNGHIKKLDISILKNLQSLTFGKIAIERLICNEMQIMTIPSLKKIIKLKPDDKQDLYIKRVELHTKALQHNWDEGTGKLNSILKSPLCDRATALAIYWMGQPGYYLSYDKASEVEEVNRKTYRFLKKLEKRIMEREFPINLLPLDPGNFSGYNWLSEAEINETPERSIPWELKKTLKGELCTCFDLEKKIELEILSSM